MEQKKMSGKIRTWGITATVIIKALQAQGVDIGISDIDIDKILEWIAEGAAVLGAVVSWWKAAVRWLTSKGLIKK